MTQNPTLTLREIAGFKLADLPIPEEGFHIESDQAPHIKELRGHEREEALDELTAEVQQIRDWIKTLEVPEVMADHPFYPDFLTYQFEVDGEEINPDSPLVQKRNILPFIPRHPDIIAATQRIQIAARQYLEQLGQTEGNDEETTPDEKERAEITIANALIQIIEDNIHTLDKQPIIRIPNHNGRNGESQKPPRLSESFNKKSSKNSAAKNQPEPVKLIGISPYTIRRAVRRLERKQNGEIEKWEKKNSAKPELKKEDEREKIRNKTCLELLVELNVLPKDLTYEEKKHIIDVEMPTCLSKATLLYEGIGKSLRKAQMDFKLGGNQVEVDINENNKFRNILELLAYVVDHARKKEAYNEGDLRKLNEAQALAKYFFDFIVVRAHPSYKSARKGEQKFRRTFVKNMFGENDSEETVQVEIDNKGNILENKDQEAFGHRSIGLRHVGISKERVYFEGIRRKTSTALVKKLNNNPSYTLDDDIFDFLGGRMFLWDITLADYKDPVKGPFVRKRVKDLARKVGESMGLEQCYVDRENLKPGQFMIADKIEENNGNGKSKNFPAMKVYGRTPEGHPVEFQLVLKDGYITSKSEGSPNHQNRYEIQKDLNLSETTFISSVHPEVHDTVRGVRRELEKLNKAWFKAHPNMNQDTEPNSL